VHLGRTLRGLAVGPLALSLAPAPLAAQASLTLRQAISSYENLDIEQARRLFNQVISPSSPFPVTQAQRDTAYRYLGATFSLLGFPDSAETYFRAALFLDAFTDLDPRIFSAQERDAFLLAKQKIFKIGVKPLARDTIDPEAERDTIRIVTTHAANIRVEVVSAMEDLPLRFTLFEGPNDGPREVLWGGQLPRGGLIPLGTYELVVTGTSAADQRLRDSVSTLFDVDHLLPSALEDTLPELSGAQLLPENLPPSAATRDLLKGLGLGAASVASSAFLGSQFGESRMLSSSVAVIGVAAGIYAFSNRRRHPEIPENVAANARARAERARQNAEIERRNGERLAQTQLVIRPLVVASP
jgi:hypothetical protein